MRLLPAARGPLVLIVLSPSAISAQSSQSVSSAPVPRLINISGVFRPASGQAAAAVETVTLSIYADQDGGAPLWQETQTIALDAQGRYSLLLGATRADGVPAAVFGSGDAKWLGTVFERAGEVEGPRVRITSVPYALRASDADTLGGLPASAYLRTPGAAAGTGSKTDSADATAGPSAKVVLAGTANFLSKYTNGTDLGNSAVFENNGSVGIGTTVPLDSLHLRFTNTNGAVTGLAVQNLGGTAASYSGMLFYDQNGALGQFQGFNNSTHEYRINNIARVSQPSGAFNGSINFMIGGVSKFYLSPFTVGIGTTSPSGIATLEVSNAVSGAGTTNVNVTTFSANGFGPTLIGKKARGTQGAPTSVLNNDALLDLSANGYGATGFASTNSASISMRASENWTDTAQGSIMNLSTTANGTTGPITRMTIGSNGNVGIGVFGAQAGLEVSNANGASGAGTVFATTFANAGTSLFVGRRARGTGIAPTAVQSGDNLVGFLAQGYGTTAFSGTRGGMFVTAWENWTNTAQGTGLNFNTTMTGTTAPATRMTLDAFGNLAIPSGNVGIGTRTPLAALDMVKETPGPLEIALTRYAGTGSSGEPNIVLRTARGTIAAPSAMQAGDELGGVCATGYGATEFGNCGAGFGAFAAENWTDTAQGSALGLGATPLGSTDAQINVVLLPGGNVGIGVFNEFPTISDRLQVFGDIRVGTAGANGCIRDFNGTGIVGTCSSDRRFKKDIAPFDHVLDRLTALQPVHYSWRASEFPDRQFGDRRAYGLIAQDVEQVLPELVVTNPDGFKAVDYSGLPLLTIQAVKDLKAEVTGLRSGATDLKSENDALKQRVGELERLVNELLAASARR